MLQNKTAMKIEKSPQITPDNNCNRQGNGQHHKAMGVENALVAGRDAYLDNITVKRWTVSRRGPNGRMSSSKVRGMTDLSFRWPVEPYDPQ